MSEVSAQERLRKIRERADRARGQSWHWAVNHTSRTIHLESHGNSSRFALEYVMDFTRWGMTGARPRFQVDGLMCNAETLSKVVEGRGHHAEWYQTIEHPDAEFIAHARADIPFLLDQLAERDAELARLRDTRSGPSYPRVEAIAKRTGVRTDRKWLLARWCSVLHAFDPRTLQDARPAAACGYRATAVYAPEDSLRASQRCRACSRVLSHNNPGGV